MKHLILALTALAMLTASVNAELGETPRQFEPGKPSAAAKFAGGVWQRWVGKRITHYGFFYKGRAAVESFWFNDHRPLDLASVTKFLKPYEKHEKGGVVYGQNSRGENLTWFFMYAPDREVCVVMLNLTTSELSIFQPDAWDHWVGMSGIKVTQRTETRVVQQPRPALQPTPDKDDCAIVASEMYARLINAGTYWVNMVELTEFYIDGKRTNGHTVVVWKISSGSNVFVYDQGIGSIELLTSSVSLDGILRALEVHYGKLFGGRCVTLLGQFAKRD